MNKEPKPHILKREGIWFPLSNRDMAGPACSIELYLKALGFTRRLTNKQNAKQGAAK